MQESLSLILKQYKTESGKTWDECCTRVEDEAIVQVFWNPNQNTNLSININNSQTIVINRSIAKTILDFITKCNKCNNQGVVQVLGESGEPQLVNCPDCQNVEL